MEFFYLPWHSGNLTWLGQPPIWEKTARVVGLISPYLHTNVKFPNKQLISTECLVGARHGSKFFAPVLSFSPFKKNMYAHLKNWCTERQFRV